MSENKRRIAIIGEGWGAMAAVGLLAREGHEIVWIKGSGARMVPALPTLNSESGARVWKSLAESLEIHVGQWDEGVHLRGYRGKAFQPVSFETPEVLKEELWGPETRWVGGLDYRFDTDLKDLDDEIRAKLAEMDSIEVMEGVPAEDIQFDEKPQVHLASGDLVTADQVIYADRWTALRAMKGLGQALKIDPVPQLKSDRKEIKIREIGRYWKPCGILQVRFEHEKAVGAGVGEGFFAPTYKDSGDKIERNVWGYFRADGMESDWTLMLASEEGEDNNEISKKLRRIKQTLNRIFVGEQWVAPDKKEFMDNVIKEHVRFEADMLFGEGFDPKGVVYHGRSVGKKSERIPSEWIGNQPRVAFITDGFGPSHALTQVGWLLGLHQGKASRADEEVEGAEIPSSEESQEARPEAQA